MMKDWSNFLDVTGKAVASTGYKPSFWSYLAIKLVDNALAACVTFFVLFFSIIGLFFVDQANKESVNWVLHAAEVCLGVLLGILKSRKN